MRRYIHLILLAVIAFSSGRTYPGAETRAREELFFKANQAYREGRFQEAIDGYTRLVQDGQGNGHLYYNLGNAYFRQNDLGKAILFYERAYRLMPRDADLRFNLGYALDQTRDAIPKNQSFIRMTFFWLNDFNLGELFWGFAIVNILFWGVLLLRFFFQREWTYYVLFVFLFFWLIAGLSFGLKWHQLATDDRAVILQKEVSVLAGPDTQDTVLFKLHEGTMVDVERSEDGWSLVRLPDKKRGWLTGDAIERIRRVD